MATNSAPSDGGREETDFGSFTQYVDHLATLLAPSAPAKRTKALNGQVAGALRSLVPLTQRRKEGAFFTSMEVADRLLAASAKPISSYVTVVDPACGAGDLLLRASEHLPLESSPDETLTAWGKVLVGRDLNPDYARLARIRLALSALSRHGTEWHRAEHWLDTALPNIRSGDGLDLKVPRDGLVLMNPPFGSMVSDQPWGSGRVARAAVFASGVAEAMETGSSLLAILPDVLRSGSNYARWRTHMEQRMEIGSIERVGQFDEWTDVDVFLMRGDTEPTAAVPPAWWPAAHADPDYLRVGDRFVVRVGPVVPHRDLETGSFSPFLRARDLPQDGEHVPGEVQLQHQGTRFAPPLVAVRRTSRPAGKRSRLTVTIIRGKAPVLVENHLLICSPMDGTLRSCRQLAEILTSATTTAWLDQRLRCRHLTVSALRDVPLS